MGLLPASFPRSVMTEWPLSAQNTPQLTLAAASGQERRRNPSCNKVCLRAAAGAPAGDGAVAEGSFVFPARAGTDTPRRRPPPTHLRPTPHLLPERGFPARPPRPPGMLRPAPHQLEAQQLLPTLPTRRQAWLGPVGAAVGAPSVTLPVTPAIHPPPGSRQAPPGHPCVQKSWALRPFSLRSDHGMGGRTPLPLTRARRGGGAPSGPGSQ